ncbi:MAG: hypothetical protein NTW87_12800 [Planctomycetota bacterium]|nr:hypothetical protein [Planctomycetota bacterium]
MPALEEGAVALSRRQIAEIARVLAPFASRGIPIVTTEPTACLCMREEFLYYVDTPETRALARQAREIGEFLMGLHKEKKLQTGFRTLNTVFGYNQACHQKALGIGTPGLDLVRLIPGVTALHIDEGCCGIAGTFGMRKRNYDEAMAIGQDLFRALNDAKEGIQYGLCESSTCRMQMEHGSGKRTLHPIQVLAEAYGYPPATPADDSWDVMDQPQASHAGASGH